MNMNKIQAFFNKADAFAAHNGMTITELREGYARAEMTLQPHHMNGAQTVHGGAISPSPILLLLLPATRRGNWPCQLIRPFPFSRGPKRAI